MHEHYHPLCMLWAKEAQIVKEQHGHTLLLKGIASQVLYVAARPKKFRSFVLTTKFISVWIENLHIFTKEPPEIGMVFSKMEAEADGIAHAIPILLSNPVSEGSHSWKFELHFPETPLISKNYMDVALFIDWLPSTHCPGPIRKTFPSMYSQEG